MNFVKKAEFAMATERINFRKNIQKINCSVADWGIKLKLFRIVSKNSLYKTIVFIAFAQTYGCYGNLNVPFTNNG